MEQANLQQELGRSLLRLTSLLQQSQCDLSALTHTDWEEDLTGNEALSVVEILHNQPSLLGNLRKAHMGNYSIIMSLLGCINNGFLAKRVADTVIDSCGYYRLSLALL